jgi:flagellar motor switch protein FliN/FliY
VNALAPAKAARDDPMPTAAAAKDSLAESGYEIAVRKKDANPLDLVMEVELAVSVSFGRAELPLRDVLKLTTGSIVELNRGLTDPVEIIVNKCIIARGEVVVIDGNYGVRIQEIVSRDKRMGTLR